MQNMSTSANTSRNPCPEATPEHQDVSITITHPACCLTCRGCRTLCCPSTPRHAPTFATPGPQISLLPSITHGHALPGVRGTTDYLSNLLPDSDVRQYAALPLQADQPTLGTPGPQISLLPSIITAVISSPMVMPFQGCAAANTSHTAVTNPAQQQASRDDTS